MQLLINHRLRHAIVTRRIPLALTGLGLLSLALFLPVEALAASMTGADPANARLGLAILRLCLALNALFLLIGVGLPSTWFQSPGLPAVVTGLVPGPQGWPAGRRRIAWRALLAILALGTLLRLIGLNQDLWLDEIATVSQYLHLPVWQIVYTYHSPNQHLLYSLLGSLSVDLWGPSAWAARLPAVLFGVGGLAALYYLARAIAPEREALLATLLLVVSYHHVWFSQSARGYTAMIFWSLLGTGLFLRGLARNRTPTWLGYVLSMGLGILSVQNTAFVFAGHLGAYFVTLPRWPGWRTRHWPLTRRVLASALAILLLSLQSHSLVLPQILTFFATEERTGLGSGIASPLQLFTLFFQGLQSGFLGAGLFIVLLLVAAGWLSYWRQSPLVASLLVLPLIFGGLAVIILQYGAFPRAFLYILPLALLLAVRGGLVLGAWLAGHWLPAGHWRSFGESYLGLALVSLMIALSLASLLFNYRYPKQDYSGALAYVTARQAAGDRISAVGLAAGGYKNYYAPGLAFPVSVAELEALRQADRSVWVLYSFPRDMRLRFSELYDYIETEGELVASFPGTLGDGTLYVSRIEGAAK